MLFCTTQLVRQLHQERTQVGCSNKEARKRLTRRHSRNGPWTHECCFEVDVFHSVGPTLRSSPRTTFYLLTTCEQAHYISPHKLIACPMTGKSAQKSQRRRGQSRDIKTGQATHLWDPNSAVGELGGHAALPLSACIAFSRLAPFSFFLGFRRPNLITGLSGLRTPDLPLRTQEPVPDRRGGLEHYLIYGTLSQNRYWFWQRKLTQLLYLCVAPICTRSQVWYLNLTECICTRSNAPKMRAGRPRTK